MITGLYAGLLGLFYVFLTFYVVKGRAKYKVSIGDGGEQDLQTRIRVHANFAEYTPIALILFGLLEIQGTSLYLMHALGIALFLGRVLHALGLDVPVTNKRKFGMMLTLSSIIIASILLILRYAGFSIL